MSAIITVDGSLLGSNFEMMPRKTGASALIAHSDRRGARDPVDFSVTSWTMPDMSSALIRLGRLMELQGIAPSPRAGAAAETVTKRKSKGASGGGGATATAAETGTPPQGFGARRIGGQTVLQIAAGDLGEVFDPADFKSEWTPGEVERVVQALPGLQLPFDPANVAASIESLDQLVFEARATARRTQRRLWSTPTSLRAMEGFRCGVM